MRADTLSGLEDARYGRLPRPRRSLSSGGAIFHLHARTGSRTNGQSARAAAAYIQRAAEYGRDQAELVYTESGHMPSWAEADPTTYWAAADLYERANGRLFKRVEVALPLALSEEEQRELAVGFAHHLTAGERLPYTLAIHAGAGTNPHAHLLISERTNDGLERAPEQWFRRYNAAAPEQGGARKSEALKPKAWLEEARAAWAELTNQALERAGHAVRIDHRSLAAQGIERLPGVHLGPSVQAMEARGIDTARGGEARRRAQVNAARERGTAALAQVNAALAALNTQPEEGVYERTRPGPERERGRAGVEREGGAVGGRAGRVAGGGRGERGPGLGGGPGASRGAEQERSAGVGTGAPDMARGDADPAPEPQRPDRAPGPADPALRTRARAVGADVEPGAVAGGDGQRGRHPGPEHPPADALLVDRAARAGPGGPGSRARGTHALSRDVERDDRGRATGDQQADTGPGPGDGAVRVQREQERAAGRIEAGQERAQQQKRAQEAARRLIEAGQERARQEKRAREQEQARQRERERARDEGLER